MLRLFKRRARIRLSSKQGGNAHIPNRPCSNIETCSPWSDGSPCAPALSHLRNLFIHINDSSAPSPTDVETDGRRQRMTRRAFSRERKKEKPQRWLLVWRVSRGAGLIFTPTRDEPVNICSGTAGKEKGRRRFAQLSRPRHCFSGNGYTPPSNIVIRSWWSRCGTGGSGNDATLTNPHKVSRKWQWWQWRPPPSCCFLDQQPAADVPIAGAENLWPTPASKIFIASLQKSNKLQTFQER